MIRAGRAALLAIAAISLLIAAAPDRWHWRLPAGIAPPAVPADNPMSRAKIELGRRLFYDADLSINGTMACSTCHEQKRGFADGNRTRPGVHGDPGRRNVPGLANVAWITPLTTADPSLATLEAQIAVPVLGENPVEMGMKGQEAGIAARFGRDPCYRRMFAAAFPETRGRIDLDAVAKAIAAFERTLISYDSPYDRERRGKPALLGPARRGAALFARDCAACHAGDNFTDGAYHAIDRPGHDTGLFEKSGRVGDEGRFRTAPLRNIALAPPYLHDGSAPTLADAIRRHGALPFAAVLTDDQAADLVAFIQSLADMRFVENPALSMPAKACGKPL